MRCRTCNTPLHHTGGYMGMLYLCENPQCTGPHKPEPDEWRTDEPPEGDPVAS